MADPRSFSEDDLDRLASLIAEPLLRAAGAMAGSPGPSRAGRVRSPVRPEPPTRGGAGRGAAPSAAPKGSVQRSVSPRSRKAATIEVGVGVSKGVIVAGRHLHLSDADARAWGLADGDLLDVRAGSGSRAITFHGVLVRAGPKYATEIHLDADEANAAALRTGDRATIVAWQTGHGTRRRLITEREIVELARRGEAIPPDGLLTPSARDRAKALGLRLP